MEIIEVIPDTVTPLGLLGKEGNRRLNGPPNTFIDTMKSCLEICQNRIDGRPVDEIPNCKLPTTSEKNNNNARVGTGDGPGDFFEGLGLGLG